MGAIIISAGIASLITFTLPRRYESHMKFLVNNERADLVISPEKDPSHTQPAEVTETQVNSEMELMKSQDILDHIAVDAKLYQSFTADKSAPPSRWGIAKATQKIQHDLTIAALRKTNIIDVVYRSGDPEVAVSVLHDLGSRYLTAHLSAHGAPGTYRFFTEQVQKYNNRLLQARTTLSEFHRQRQLFSLPQQQAAAVERFNSVSAQLKDVTSNIHEQQARFAEMQTQLATLPERVTTQIKTIPNLYAAEHLQSKLADLRNKRVELAMKFRPNDRFLVEVDRQIATSETELREIQQGKSTEQTTDLDTLRQAFKAEYSRAQIELKALESRRKDLAALHQGYIDDLGSMEHDKVILQNLEQGEREALDNYTVYSHRLDEARLADSLDLQKFSNVIMIEKPVSSPIPVSPKLGMNLALGALMGLSLSLAIAFYRESQGQYSGAKPQSAP